MEERKRLGMGTIVDFRTTCSNLDVEFEIMPLVDIDDIEDERAIFMSMSGKGCQRKNWMK